MTSVTTKPDSSHPTSETAVYLFDNWFDPIEGGLRDRVREFIHAMIEGELDMALSRPRYARHAKSPSGEAEETVGVTGHRHAIGRYRRDVILGAACLRPDQHAQDRWLADARHKAHRSTD